MNVIILLAKRPHYSNGNPCLSEFQKNLHSDFVVRKKYTVEVCFKNMWISLGAGNGLYCNHNVQLYESWERKQNH